MAAKAGLGTALCIVGVAAVVAVWSSKSELTAAAEFGVAAALLLSSNSELTAAAEVEVVAVSDGSSKSELTAAAEFDDGGAAPDRPPVPEVASDGEASIGTLEAESSESSSAESSGLRSLLPEPFKPFRMSSPAFWIACWFLTSCC